MPFVNQRPENHHKSHLSVLDALTVTLIKMPLNMAGYKSLKTPEYNHAPVQSCQSCNELLVGQAW